MAKLQTTGGSATGSALTSDSKDEKQPPSFSAPSSVSAEASAAAAAAEEEEEEEVGEGEVEEDNETEADTESPSSAPKGKDSVDEIAEDAGESLLSLCVSPA
jgi:hypothetical protein